MRAAICVPWNHFDGPGGLAARSQQSINILFLSRFAVVHVSQNASNSGLSDPMARRITKSDENHVSANAARSFGKSPDRVRDSGAAISRSRRPGPRCTTSSPSASRLLPAGTLESRSTHGMASDSCGRGHPVDSRCEYIARITTKHQPNRPVSYGPLFFGVVYRQWQSAMAGVWTTACPVMVLQCDDRRYLISHDMTADFWSRRGHAVRPPTRDNRSLSKMSGRRRACAVTECEMRGKMWSRCSLRALCPMGTCRHGSGSWPQIGAACANLVSLVCSTSVCSVVHSRLTDPTCPIRSS